LQKRYATTCQVFQYNIHIKVVFALHPTAMLASNPKIMNTNSKSWYNKMRYIFIQKIWVHLNLEQMYEENIFEIRNHVVKYITEAKKKV